MNDENNRIKENIEFQSEKILIESEESIKKLELKHLVGYLPYGLKVMIDLGKSYSIANLSENGFDRNFLYNLSQNKVQIFGLRPLSDLTKFCEDLGFVPIEQLYKIQWDGTHHLSDKNKYYTIDVGLITKCSHNSTAMETSMNIKYPLNNNYWKIEKLLEWHFDIHNLIENNLAIDINTL